MFGNQALGPAVLRASVATRQIRNCRHGAAVISAGKACNWQLAWMLLHDMGRATVLPGTPAVNSTVHACGRVVQWERAISLVHVGMFGQEGGTLDVIGYGAAIAACMRATMWAKTLELLLSMETVRVLPNALCYTASMAACGRDYQWPLALHLLMTSQRFLRQRGLAGSHKLNQKEQKRFQAMRCAQAAAQACEVSHQWEQVVALLAWVVGDAHSPNAEFFEQVISACDRGRAWTKAVAAFSDAQALGHLSSRVQNCALKACARSSVWTAALSIFASCETSNSSLAITALSACERASQWVRALTLFRHMCLNSVDSSDSVLRCTLRSFGVAKHWQAALHLFVDSHARQGLDAWAISAVAWACESAGEYDKALDFLAAIRHDYLLASKKNLPKEFRVLEFVRRHAQRGDLGSVIETIERFALDHQWLKIMGGRKSKIFDSCIHPGDKIVELGAYIGYSALRLECRRRTLTSCCFASEDKPRITAVEAHPWTAMVARAIVDFAGASEEIIVRVGRATDWLRPPSVLGPIDVLVLDHRGTSYHEDLMIAEPYFRQGARVIADNVLHPGAPQLLAYVAGRYKVIGHSVQEFGHIDLDDWILEMKFVHQAQGIDSQPDPYADPEMRRWSAEVDRKCSQSQERPVDWVELQKRMRPALEEFIRRSRM